MRVTTEADDAWWPPTFSPSTLGPDVVGVMDHPDGEPEHFLFDRVQRRQPRAVAVDRWGETDLINLHVLVDRSVRLQPDVPTLRSVRL